MDRVILCVENPGIIIEVLPRALSSRPPSEHIGAMLQKDQVWESIFNMQSWSVQLKQQLHP